MSSNDKIVITVGEYRIIIDNESMFTVQLDTRGGTFDTLEKFKNKQDAMDYLNDQLHDDDNEGE